MSRPVHRRLIGSRLRKLATVGATVGLLVGTIGFAGPAAAADEPLTFRMGMTRPPQGMNPLFAGGWILSYTYEPLVGVQTDSPDYKFPLFAESWSANDDATVWTFKISPDLKWSDGEPATANDVVFTYTYEKQLVADGFAVRTLANLDAIKEVKAIDDQTVEFTLTGPADILTGVLNNSYIFPEHIWGSMTGEQAEVFANDPPLVGTGPWELVEYQEGQFARFEPNANFRGPGPFVDEVIVSFFTTADAQAQALKKGDIDLATEVPVASFDQLSTDPNIKTIAATLAAYQALSFNVMTGEGKGSTSALLDQKFRDALGYAIDKQTLVDKILQGNGSVMESLVTEMSGDYKVPLANERTFDLEKAKQLLEAAGYVDSDGDNIREDKDGKPLQLSMLVQQGAQMATAGQYIADWFGQVGVQVNANAVEESTFFEKAFSTEDQGGGGWDITIEQTYQNPWPGDFLVWWTTSKLGSMNASHWTDPQYDALVDQVLTTADSAKLHELSLQAEQILYDANAFVPLYENYWLQAYRTDKFEGWFGCTKPDGLVAYCMPPELTVYNLKPIGAAPSAEPSEGAPSTPAESAAASASPAPSGGGSTSTGGDNTVLIVGGAVVVIVVVVALYLMRRRRS